MLLRETLPIVHDMHVVMCLIVQRHHINQIHWEVMETVLLKAAVLACHKTTDDEVTAIETLCKVSRVWWHAIMNCTRRKRVAFQHYIDSKSLCVLLNS